jgi:hypothetical protein
MLPLIVIVHWFGPHYFCQGKIGYFIFEILMLEGLIINALEVKSFDMFFRSTTKQMDRFAICNNKKQHHISLQYLTRPCLTDP